MAHHLRDHHYRRAVLLGAVTAALSACGGSTLLLWSWATITQVGLTAQVPVHDGLTMLFAALAGLILCSLAFICTQGALAVRGASSRLYDPDLSDLRPHGLALRVGTVFLALTLSAPSAHAATSADSPTSIAVVTQSTTPPLRPPRPHDEVLTFPMPDWQQTTPAPATPLLPRPTPKSSNLNSSALGATRPLTQEGVVITRGDTLWSIAARNLGPQATDTQIAAHWPRWHHANRLTIGPDPHVLQPGHVLQPPPTATPAPTHSTGDRS